MIVTSVRTAVNALTALAKKKYQHQLKAQPGTISSDDIYIIGTYFIYQK